MLHVLKCFFLHYALNITEDAVQAPGYRFLCSLDVSCVAPLRTSHWFWDESSMKGYNLLHVGLFAALFLLSSVVTGLNLVKLFGPEFHFIPSVSADNKAPVSPKAVCFPPGSSLCKPKSCASSHPLNGLISEDHLPTKDWVFAQAMLKTR